MTSNLWKKMKLICGSEHEETQMQIDTNNGKNLIYYKCPICSNMIGSPDADRMIEKIDKVLTQTALDGNTVNLTNMSWKTQKGIFYKVICHDASTDSFIVSVLNKQPIK